MNNYQDRYIRENPRKNAKMSPVLWDDNTSGYFSYNKKEEVVEGFNGGYENKVGIYPISLRKILFAVLISKTNS